VGAWRRREIRIAEELRKKGVVVSYRGALGVSGVRVSTHLYNDKEDVDAFVDELSRLRTRGSGFIAVYAC